MVRVLHERSFYQVDRFANGKKNYGYGKKQVTEDMHRAKREELEKQYVFS
ncbi:MAG: hypothetical protein U9Q37_04090 [Euryarchaeota archaeon]|nr:hypothetical protein [Euryarchaeota archaeon]